MPILEKKYLIAIMYANISERYANATYKNFYLTTVRMIISKNL